MPNNLHISYDLNAPGQRYDKVAEAIQQLGSWAKVQKSFWYVSSNYTAEQAAKHVWAAMDASDSLYVVNASDNTAHWFNIPPECAKLIQDRWFAMA